MLLEIQNALLEKSNMSVFLPVKLDQPSIVKIGVVPKRFGCLQLTWKLSKQQAWLHHNPFNLDIRLKTADSSQPVSSAQTVNTS